jgi:biotin carboxyl carrier protein
LVTPTSQIVGIQTVNNVLFDQPGNEYSKITEQVKDLCFGLYGRTTKPIKKEVQNKALKEYPRGHDPISDRPGNILDPELPHVKEETKGLAKNIDDELIVALYPVTGKRFLRWKYGMEDIPKEVKPKSLEEIAKERDLIEKALSGKLNLQASPIQKPADMRTFDVYVDGEHFNVEVADTRKQVTGVRTSPKAVKAAVEDSAGNLVAPIPGMILEFKKQVGDKVKAGDTVVVLEAMKMFNNLAAPCDGTVKSINMKAGDSVSKGDILCVIE